MLLACRRWRLETWAIVFAHLAAGCFAVKVDTTDTLSTSITDTLTDTITDTDRQRTQVEPDPLDYVLRYSAADYDCYHQGRYIGSRPTLPKAVAAVEEQQAKTARHPQSASAANTTIEAWLGSEPRPPATLDEVVRRYLRAYGPASSSDLRSWSGLSP